MESAPSRSTRLLAWVEQKGTETTAAVWPWLAVVAYLSPVLMLADLIDPKTTGGYIAAWQMLLRLRAKQS